MRHSKLAATIVMVLSTNAGWAQPLNVVHSEAVPDRPPSITEFFVQAGRALMPPTSAASSEVAALATPERSAKLEHAAKRPPLFVREQDAGHLLAADLVGMEVRNWHNEDLGEVADLLLGSDGAIEGVVIGVGGFLGLGVRNVAIAWNAIDLERRGGAMWVLRVDCERKDLERAPAYQRLLRIEAASNTLPPERVRTTAGP